MASLRELAMAFEGQSLDPRSLWRFARTALDPQASWTIGFSDAVAERMQASAETVARMARTGEPVYGVNTGFGHFAERRIPAEDLEILQTNLIRSHACGVGEEASRDIVLAMWLLRLNTISHGLSGIGMRTVGFFLRLLESGVLACVPSRGSVGASGDLVPSAHAVLPILGEGFCTRANAAGDGFERLPAAQVLADLRLQPTSLGPKEGLVLINGTQYATALAIKAWYEAGELLRIANLAAAMSMAAMGGSLTILDETVLKTHHVQTYRVGQEMGAWLDIGRHAGDAATHRFVQSPYCLRCAPQVHGAVLLALEEAEAALAAEIAVVSDNPLIFPDSNGGEARSCGNFHGTYPARVSDSLVTALTTLGSISERRINMAMDEHLSGLPCFLTENGGLNSGLMITQVVAASLVAECRTLCFPASVDSIPTNCDREDHVPMGPVAGLKALRVVDLVQDILAIELLVAAQALDLRRYTMLPPRLARVHRMIREQVPFLGEDRILAPELEKIRKMIRTQALWDKELQVAK